MKEDTSTFDRVRQYITGTSGSEKHIHRRTGYVLSRRQTSTLLDRVRRYARGGSEKDIVELTGYVLPSKGQTDSVIELVRRAVRKKRTIFMDELERRTGYRMPPTSRARFKAGAEDLNSVLGCCSRTQVHEPLQGASVASMALQSNAVSSGTILSTLEKSFLPTGRLRTCPREVANVRSITFIFHHLSHSNYRINQKYSNTRVPEKFKHQHSNTGT